MLTWWRAGAWGVVWGQDGGERSSGERMVIELVVELLEGDRVVELLGDFPGGRSLGGEGWHQDAGKEPGGREGGRASWRAGGEGEGSEALRDLPGGDLRTGSQ